MAWRFSFDTLAAVRPTVKGPVWVSWKKSNDELRVRTKAPEGVTLNYVPNESHAGLRIFINDMVMNSNVK